MELARTISLSFFLSLILSLFLFRSRYFSYFFYFNTTKCKYRIAVNAARKWRNMNTNENIKLNDI